MRSFSWILCHSLHTFRRLFTPKHDLHKHPSFHSLPRTLSVITPHKSSPISFAPHLHKRRSSPSFSQRRLFVPQQQIRGGDGGPRRRPPRAHARQQPLAVLRERHRPGHDPGHLTRAGSSPSSSTRRPLPPRCVRRGRPLGVAASSRKFAQSHAASRFCTDTGAPGEARCDRDKLADLWSLCRALSNATTRCSSVQSASLR